MATLSRSAGLAAGSVGWAAEAPVEHRLMAATALAGVRAGGTVALERAAVGAAVSGHRLPPHRRRSSRMGDHAHMHTPGRACGRCCHPPQFCMTFQNLLAPQAHPLNPLGQTQGWLSCFARYATARSRTSLSFLTRESLSEDFCFLRNDRIQARSFGLQAPHRTGPSQQQA